MKGSDQVLQLLVHIRQHGSQIGDLLDDLLLRLLEVGSCILTHGNSAASQL